MHRALDTVATGQPIIKDLFRHPTEALSGKKSYSGNVHRALCTVATGQPISKDLFRHSTIRIDGRRKEVTATRSQGAAFELMTLLQTAVLCCPFFCPTKGGFYGSNEAGPGDVLHEGTGCSNERFLARSEFI